MKKKYCRPETKMVFLLIEHPTCGGMRTDSNGEWDGADSRRVNSFEDDEEDTSIFPKNIWDD